MDPRNLGVKEHWIDERWILQFLREIWGCNTYYEAISKLNGRTYNGHHPDLSAVIGDGDESKEGYSEKLMRFRKWLFSFQRVIPFTKEMKENIYQINIDFHHSIEMRWLIEKAVRRYHGKHKILVIVLTGSKMSGKEIQRQLLEQDEVKDLDYKENIFVLNTKEFAEFIGLRENTQSPEGDSYYEKFVQGSTLYNDAFYGAEPELKNLAKVSDECKYVLQKEFLKRFGENDGKTKGWLAYLSALKLLQVVKDNPYPYDKEKEVDDSEQTRIDNFLGDK